MKQKIPRCMSTQHPDNVRIPFFSENNVLAGEDEIKEAFFAFAHLGIDEQMIDYEGKEVDNFFVKKLCSKYESFFKEKKLGKDIFLTYRLPNPEIEKNEGKILLEALESIPRNFDIAKAFYNEDIAPVFETILPMTTSAESLKRIKYYYEKIVAGKQEKKLFKKDKKIKEIFGFFMPETINVIPLIEDIKNILEIKKIVLPYIQEFKIEQQRVFLARSDPALNYGMISAELINLIALQELKEIEEKYSIELNPIVGVGAAPFRGNFNPERVKQSLNQLRSVQTFTIQSAFKYDFDEEKTREAIKEIKEFKKREAIQTEKKELLKIIEKYSKEYQKQITILADIINKIALFVPERRKRKLHIGLFGYSRKMNKISLPRTIKFVAALYSIGLPPEILGINALTEKDFDIIQESYFKIDNDLKDALQYLNVKTLNLLPEKTKNKMLEKIKNIDFETNIEHKKITDNINKMLAKKSTNNLTEEITKAAWLRRFLG